MIGELVLDYLICWVETNQLLQVFSEKINKRVQCWEGRLISQAGKEVLIKSIAQTLPTFAKSVFLLPLEITKDLERILSKFWWNSKPSTSKGIHWMSWNCMSTHKSTGGLGFRDFRDFNLAMLGKQGWWFLTKSCSLVSQLYKARYFPGSNILESCPGNNPSFIRRSICYLMSRTSISHQMPMHQLITQFHHLWVIDRRGQDEDIIQDMFNEREKQCIRSIPISEGFNEDRLYWSN